MMRASFYSPYKSALITLSLFLLLSATAAQAQTTSFTYQGRLQDGGTAANGNYDLQFTLWDALSGGTQQPQPAPVTVTRSAVAVANGIFTVQLDFGANAFPAADRFLEVGVRPSGGSSFTILSPRQQTTSTPYAIHSANATTANSATNATTATNASQLGGVAASQYVVTGDSRLTDSRPPTPGSANYIQNTTSQQAGSNFNISGNGTAAGTLSGNIVNATTQYNAGGNRVLSSDAAKENLFAGVGAGQSNTAGFENSFFGWSAGISNTGGGANTFVGFDAGENNKIGVSNSFFGTAAGGNTGLNNTSSSFNSFFGIGAGVTNQNGSSNTSIGAGADLGSNSLNNATAIGSEALVAQSNSLVLGSINGVNGATADTNVGIGTPSPQSRLHVNGTGWFSADTTPLPSAAGKGVAIGNLTAGGYVFAFDYAGAGATRPLLLNSPGGNVGIGTTAPDQILSVNGNADKSVGGGSWAVFSDERLKNIKGRFTPGLKAVMQLQPIRYEYKPDNAMGIKSEGEQIGFSAQTVQKLIPEAVTKNDKGYLLVNNDPIMWTMLNAIKEQQAQISQQQEIIKRQQDKAKEQSTAFRTQQEQLDALKKLVCRSHRRASVCR